MNAPHAERRPRSGGDGARADATNVGTSVEPAGLFAVQRRAYGSIEFTAASYDAPVASGTERRDTGHRRVSQTVGAEPWLGLAGAWIETAAARGVRFTGETVRAAVGEPPATNLIGVAVKRAQLRGLIVADGVEVARRPEAHGRLIRRWAAPSTSYAGGAR